jgi:outer membrane receptor protein involved in Fe transport
MPAAGAFALIGHAPVSGAETDQTASVLDEVTVTATRRVETVNTVPLSIQAVTQENLDRQGIKSSADLVRAVPGLATVANPGGAQQTFSIRGIVGGTGAATTSVYLDDTNLSKRSNGGVSQNNGVVAPLLYDLERVEVLKGPQGTLFGGSSEGGTVRYITPIPSLTDYSGSARAEVSDMGDRSELSHELAGAFGGPLVRDTLGFRVSGIRRESGGWIDMVSAYTNQTLREDANSRTDWAARASLLWQLGERFDAQLSAYHVDNEAEGGLASQTAVFLPNQQLAPESTTFTTQARCITNQTRTAPLAQPGGGGAASFVPTNTAPAANGTCPAGTRFVRPSVTYGPFRTGRDINLAQNRVYPVGATSSGDVFSLTLNWDLGIVDVKSITSYLMDEGTSNVIGNLDYASTTPGTGQRTTADTVHSGFPLFSPLFSVAPDGFVGAFDALNSRRGIEQEFRLTYANPTSPFSVVAGAYFSHLNTDIDYIFRADPNVIDAAFQLMYGDMSGPVPNTSEGTARYGVVNDAGFMAKLRADILDEEAAIFAEANYWLVPEKLRMTAGVRYSKVDLSYAQSNYGQFSGRIVTTNGALLEGETSDKPVTPKLGLQYQFTGDKFIYASASKGFRAGGVSSQVSQTICQAALDNLGITAADIKPTFGPDTVKSYELGGKFRLFDRMQLNMAGYRIDWNDVQATTTLACGQGFTANGGRARSQGGELSLQLRPIDPVQLYLNASYVDAHYVDPVTGPVGADPRVAPTPSFNAGDKFDVSPFSLSGGAEYDFEIASMRSYVRLDATYQKAYTSGATFGSGGFAGNYFLRNNPERTLLNLRAGMQFQNGLEANLFVLNLLDEDKLVTGFGDGRLCTPVSPGPGQPAPPAAADCSNYGNYNPFVEQTYETPRRYGIQLSYRF